MHLTKFKAVSNCEAWNYLNPESDMGFMFTRDNIVNLIGVECEKLGAGHSGASFAMCMRSMQFIAQQGWNKFVYKTFIGCLFIAIFKNKQTNNYA